MEELRSQNVKGDDFQSSLEKTISENFRRKSSSKGERKKMDVASHFILRAAYCSTEDLRRWFLQQECQLFQYRLDKIANAQLLPRVLAKYSNANMQRLSNEEKLQLQSKLMADPRDFVKTTYYKIPFTQALDLVAKRQCYVANGMAYVPLPKIISILTAQFRVALSKSLVLTSAAFSSQPEDARIQPLLQSMNHQYTGSSHEDAHDQPEGMLYAQNVSQFTKHMPLCMSQMHAGLTRDHKLKHNGRLQYTLFLKGAGLSMEESLQFFQQHFTKLISSQQFHKQYSYTIRHLYGKEGKRQSRKPYNCTKIILGQPPQSGENHGCPYKHYDTQNLSALLNKMQIGNPSQRKEILQLKDQKQHQLACAKHFQVSHPNVLSTDIDLSNVGSHPNAWFASSVNYHNAQTKPESILSSPTATTTTPTK